MKLPDFFSLKKGIDEFGASLRETGQRIEALKREREDVVAAPAAPSDAKAYFHRIIDSRGAEYLEAIARHLKPMSPEDMANDQHVAHYGNLLAISAVGGGATPRTIDTALCCLMAQPLKDAIDRVIDSMPSPPNALTLAERGAKLKKIDAELDELLARERELAATARSVGISLGAGAWDGEKVHAR